MERLRSVEPECFWRLAPAGIEIRVLASGHDVLRRLLVVLEYPYRVPTLFSLGNLWNMGRSVSRIQALKSGVTDVSLVDPTLRHCVSFGVQAPVPHGGSVSALCGIGRHADWNTPVSEPIREALARMSAALDRLDAASLRHADGDRARLTLETELSLMREDRHQLARALDEEKAARSLAETHLGDLAPRIDRAIAALRQSLAQD